METSMLILLISVALLMMFGIIFAIAYYYLKKRKMIQQAQQIKKDKDKNKAKAQLQEQLRHQQKEKEKGKNKDAGVRLPHHRWKRFMMNTISTPSPDEDVKNKYQQYLMAQLKDNKGGKQNELPPLKFSFKEPNISEDISNLQFAKNLASLIQQQKKTTDQQFKKKITTLLNNDKDQGNTGGPMRHAEPAQIIPREYKQKPNVAAGPLIAPNPPTGPMRHAEPAHIPRVQPNWTYQVPVKVPQPTPQPPVAPVPVKKVPQPTGPMRHAETPNIPRLPQPNPSSFMAHAEPPYIQQNFARQR